MRARCIAMKYSAREMRMATTQSDGKSIDQLFADTENKIAPLWILNARDIRNSIDDGPQCISGESEMSCVPQVHASDKSWKRLRSRKALLIQRAHPALLLRNFERPLYALMCFELLESSERFNKHLVLLCRYMQRYVYIQTQRFQLTSFVCWS